MGAGLEAEAPQVLAITSHSPVQPLANATSLEPLCAQPGVGQVGLSSHSRVSL